MNVLILSRNRFLYSTRRLVTACEKQGHSVVVTDPSVCTLGLGANPELRVDGESIASFDLVVARLGLNTLDAGDRVLRFLEDRSVPSINSCSAIERAHDKFGVMLALNKAEVSAPQSLLVRNPEDLRWAVESLGGAPLIAKTLKGNQGFGVMLLESLRSLVSVCDTFFARDEALILQEFIDEAQGSDTRAFVIGDEVVAAVERRSRAGDFRANMHQGAELIEAKLSPEMTSIALEAARALNLQVAGVDILQGADGFVVVDVNASPGFEGVEEATGIDIATRIVEFGQSLAKS